MGWKFWGFHFLFVILSVFSEVQGYTYSSSSYDIYDNDDLMDKLREMDKTIETLSENVQDLVDFNTKLKRAVGVLYGESGDVASPTTNEFAADIRWVRIKPSDMNMTNYVVRIASVRHVVVSCSTTGRELEKDGGRERVIVPSVLKLSETIKEASCLVENGEYVRFNLSDQESSMSFVMSKTFLYDGEDEEVEIDGTSIVFPKVEAPSKRDIVHEEGEDGTLTMKAKRSNQDVKVDITVSMYGYKFIRGKFFYETDLNRFLQVKKEKLTNTKDELTYIFDTSETETSGLIIFSITRNTPSEMVTATAISKVYTLRPASQRSPFPEGSIGFVKPDGEDWYYADHSAKKCKQEDGDCVLACEVIGADVLDVYTSQSDDNYGETEMTPLIAEKQIKYGLIRRAEVKLPSPWKDGAPLKQIITCKAKSIVYGTETTKKFTVNFVVEPRIEEGSMALMIPREEEAEELRYDLNLTCIATGGPDLDIRFTVKFNQDVYPMNIYPHSRDLSGDGLTLTAESQVEWENLSTWGEELTIQEVRCIAQSPWLSTSEEIPLKMKKPNQ